MSSSFWSWASFLGSVGMLRWRGGGVGLEVTVEVEAEGKCLARRAWADGFFGAGAGSGMGQEWETGVRWLSWINIRIGFNLE